MNTKMIAAVCVSVAVLLMASVFTVSADAESTEEVEYTDQVQRPVSGTNLGTLIDDCQDKTNLTIILENNGTYTLNMSGTNYNYHGHNLTIVGNGSTIELKNGENKVQLYYPAISAANPQDYSNLYGSIATISDVNFVAPDFATSCTFSLNGFQYVNLSGCSFDTALFSAYAYSNVDYNDFTVECNNQSRYSISDCTWSTDGNALPGYGITVLCANLDMRGSSISGYGEGVNVMAGQYEGSGSVSLSDNTFEGLHDGAGIQVSYSTDAVTVTDCTFDDCEVGIQVHYSSDPAGVVKSSSNSFIGCQSDFRFSSNRDTGATSGTSVVSDGDLFTTSSGQQKEPSITAGDNAVEPPMDIVINNPVQMEPDLPPIIWDDDDEYIPPIVPVQPEDSGDDSVTVVACAAAAVVAALMAAFLIMDRKR